MHIHGHPERDLVPFHLVVKDMVSGVRLSSDPTPTVTAALTCLSTSLPLKFSHLNNEDNNDDLFHEGLGK